MLAGKMKLNHFIAIVGLVGVAGIVGAYFACRGGDDGDDEVARNKARGERKERAREGDTARTAPTPRHVAGDPIRHADPPPSDDQPPPANDNLRDVDRELMSWVGKDLGDSKKKDARKGVPWKINLYQDDGSSTVNRAKVDLDRDDKWDEKWTFDGKNISRQVSTNDDDNYTEEYDWDGSSWVKR